MCFYAGRKLPPSQARGQQREKVCYACAIRGLSILVGVCKPTSVMSARLRSLAWLLWFLCIALWIFDSLFPISTQSTRLAGIGLALLVAIGLIALCGSMR